MFSATPDTAEYTLNKSSNYIQGSAYSEIITGLQPRATYYFWIKARNEANNWSVWSDTSTAVPGSFVDISAGLTGVSACSSSWGDYDNDGDLDLALAGWMGSGTQSNIYRNDGVILWILARA